MRDRPGAKQNKQLLARQIRAQELRFQFLRHSIVGILAFGVAIYSNVSVAADRVVFVCNADGAVGFEHGSWTPTVFSNGSQIRIVEQDWNQGRWVVQVLYGDWSYVSSGPRDDELWFGPAASLAGQHFMLNLKTLRYSFTDSLAYLYGGSGPVRMSIGTCHGKAAT